MARPFFVTGTGTDIGKTHILCAMLEAHRKAGGKARVLKPVISGFDMATIQDTDTLRLLVANGDPLTSEQVKATSPWRFRDPLSPDMAARAEARRLSLTSVSSWCLDQIKPTGLTVIEGAGGIMSPIAEDGLNLDLIRELDARPILVAGTYLGTISHTLTALRVLDGPATVILNPHKPGNIPVRETVRSLQRFAPRADIRVFDARNPAGLLDIFDVQAV